MNNMNIIKWLSQISILDDELSKLRQPRCNNIIDNNKYDFKTLIDSTLISSNQYFSFDECATNIIDKLFAEYVDDDTLVITTRSEHPSVVNNLNKCKHIYHIITRNQFILDDSLRNIIKHYKKIFVYVIGLSSGDNCAVSNQIFEVLQQIIGNIPHIFVLDAVQEMFILPRDYSIFDYVIGTAHAIIPQYNRGIVISKDKPYCQQLYDDDLFERLQIVNKYKNELSLFNYIMQSEFSIETMIDKNLHIYNTSPYILILCDDKNRLTGLNEHYIDHNVQHNDIVFEPVFFRAFPALIDRKKFSSLINKVHLRLSI